jgi:hypothetical protein
MLVKLTFCRERRAAAVDFGMNEEKKLRSFKKENF